MQRPDIAIEDCGSVVLLRPMTPEGETWLSENIHAESWQWFGDAIACDPRYIEDVAVGAQCDGLEVDF